MFSNVQSIVLQICQYLEYYNINQKMIQVQQTHSYQQLTQLAQSLLKCQNYQLRLILEKRLSNIILNFHHLETLIQFVHQSKSLLFLFSQILSKQILNQTYFPKQSQLDWLQQQENSQNSQSFYQQQNQKYRQSLKIILCKINWIIRNVKLQNYILNSLINLAVACLRDLLKNNYIQQVFRVFIKQYFEGYTLNRSMMYDNEIKIENVFQKMLNIQNFGKIYNVSTKILIQLIESLSSEIYFKNFSSYQKYLLSFKMYYLIVFLQMSAYYLKLLQDQIKQVRNNEKQIEYLLRLSSTIYLFDVLIAHPFGVKTSTSSSQGEQQFKKNFSQIILPNYYKKIIIGNFELIRGIGQIFKYFCNRKFLQTEKSQLIIKNLKHCINISVNLCSINVYSFAHKFQFHNFRAILLQILFIIIQTHNIHHLLLYHQVSHLHDIVEFVLRVFKRFSMDQFITQIIKIIPQIIKFTISVLENCSIFQNPQQQNLSNKIFEMLRVIYEAVTYQTKIYERNQINQLSEELKKYINQFFKFYIKKIGHKKQLQFIQELKFKNYTAHNQYYYNMFSHISYIYQLNLSKNAQLFLQDNNLQNMPQTQNAYIRLHTVILAQSKTINCSKESQYFYHIILQIFEISKSRQQLCHIHFLQVFTNNVVCEYRNFKSWGNVWLRFANNPQQFEQYLCVCVQKCIQSIANDKQEVVESSLNLMESIYNKSKQIFIRNCDIYFKKVLQNLNKLQDGYMGRIQNMKRRSHLYQLISRIWIVKSQYKSNIYQIRSIITKFITQQPNLNSLVKYFYDCIGIINSVSNKQIYINITQIFLLDFLKITKIYFFSDQAIAKILTNPIICKSILHYFYAILEDKDKRISEIKHNNILIVLHNIASPILKYCGIISKSKRIVSIYRKISMYNPLKPLLPIPKLLFSAQKKSLQKSLIFNRHLLLEYYFHEIHRYENLDQLYGYGEQNYIYLKLWYEQAIYRNHPLKLNILKRIILSKNWKNSQQKKVVEQIICMVDGKLTKQMSQLLVNKKLQSQIYFFKKYYGIEKQDQI